MSEYLQDLRIFQIVAAIVSLGFIIRLGVQVYRRKRSLFSALIWGFFWIMVTLLSIAPDLLSDLFARFLGFKDNVHAILFIGLGLSFLIIFYLSSVIDRVEKQMSQLVRTLAHREAESDGSRTHDSTPS